MKILVLGSGGLVGSSLARVLGQNKKYKIYPSTRKDTNLFIKDETEKLINDVVTTLYADPIYLVIALIISGLLIFSLVKKLLKIAMYVAAIAILYLGYLYFTGETADSVIGGFQNVTDDVKSGIEESLDKVIKKDN